ncbi:universal stress protein [Lysobacter firmicutimachus]|uniref:Universal stress protein n=1 Tax=Lysobacter firmicutimachus TaxID=1792846 RepID=A0ABU8D1X1_9GAMM
MFKDILVPLLLGDIQPPVLRTACALAEAGGGQVTALVGVSLAAPIADAWDYYPAGLYETMRESALATTDAIAEAVELRLAGESARWSVRKSESFWLTPGEICVQHARYADLTVLGTGQREAPARRRLFAALLGGSGRPVLLVPEDWAGDGRVEHVVLAWKSSREAARALHDAMPLLARARSVDLLMVDHDFERDSQADPMGFLLGSHLQRHGIPAELVRRSAERSSVGEVVAAHARESGADLIVAGGYSHPRLLEDVLGGVTRYLLDHTPVPVLFSH